MAITLWGGAQPIPVTNTAGGYPFINTAANHISNAGVLDSFYRKLQVLQKTGKGSVKIVHIGDSHLQAGYLSAIVRKGLQSFFGNAGRGLVFPYRLASSNAPDDISTSSNVSWAYNRVARPELPGNPGISGFYISSSTASPRISMALKPDADVDQSFTRIRFFTEPGNSWIVQAGTSSTPYVIKSEAGDTAMYDELLLDEPATSFSMTAVGGSSGAKKLHGVSLEKAAPGILYHTIGVNGARYDSYSNAALFLQQLPALNADLYIISLGTNEAQKPAIDQQALIATVTSFITKLRLASPGAAVLLTTPADSYLGGRQLSAPMSAVHSALALAASSADLALWDLYFITGGFGSSRSWASAHLLSGDRVHYTKAGYELQGSLLLAALANGYNQFIGKAYNPFDTMK
jgi:lysophospholipase L1-like esterase